MTVIVAPSWELPSTGAEPLPEGYTWRKDEAGSLELWHDNDLAITVGNHELRLSTKLDEVSLFNDPSGTFGALTWKDREGNNTGLLLDGTNASILRFGDETPIPLLTSNSAIKLWRELNSMVTISKNDNPQLHNFTVNGSPGYADWEYRMIPLTLPDSTEVGEIRGRAFSVQDNGTVLCNKDMYGASVDLLLVGNWAKDVHISIGVGIGDPRALRDTVIVPGEPGGPVYISRFTASSTGNGDGRDTTLSVTAQPIGRTSTDISTAGIRMGDLIFPVIWAEETDPVPIKVKDLLFVLREITV